MGEVGQSSVLKKLRFMKLQASYGLLLVLEKHICYIRDKFIAVFIDNHSLTPIWKYTISTRYK